jgi:hypothetical protein
MVTVHAMLTFSLFNLICFSLYIFVNSDYISASVAKSLTTIVSYTIVARGFVAEEPISFHLPLEDVLLVALL